MADEDGLGALSRYLRRKQEDDAEVGDGLAMVVGPLRKFVRSVDRLMDAADSLVTVGKETDYEKVAVFNAFSRWQGTLATVYGSFAQAREAMYRVAARAQVPVKRFAKKGAKPSVAKMTDEQLETEIASTAASIGTGLQRLAEMGATLLQTAERLQGASAEDPKVASLVAGFLDFRDVASTELFARFAGLARRINARAKREGDEVEDPESHVAKAPAKKSEPEPEPDREATESKGGSTIKVPWKDDPELGDVEL